MNRAHLGDWASTLLGPTPIAIILSVLLVLSGPLILHLFLYRSTASTAPPTILLVGSSESGKTSLSALFERGKTVATHTTQIPATVECTLPSGILANSSRYRSSNDSSNQISQKFLLLDTPGHGKLRHFTYDLIMQQRNLNGIIFVIDASCLNNTDDSSSDSSSLRQSAEFLHDLLLTLQQRVRKSKTSSDNLAIPVLIAVNKLDLFTAYPANIVGAALEKEISQIRSSRNKGLLDSGVGSDGLGAEIEWLAEASDGKFTFSHMAEFHIDVKIIGGSAAGADEPEVKKWWEWIAAVL